LVFVGIGFGEVEVGVEVGVEIELRGEASRGSCEGVWRVGVELQTTGSMTDSWREL
jgi:hypothetical protein